MIGDWNESGCILALAPYAWARGNGTVDQNTGEFPGYPNGNYNATLTNMAAGYGFVTADSVIKFDGANDYVQTSYSPTYSNVSIHTWEVKFKHVANAASQFLFQRYVDANTFAEIFIRSDNKVDMRFRKAGSATDVVTTTNTLTNGNTYTVHGVKNGATLKIFINGVEASYDEQETYARGDLTPSTAMGFSGSSTAPFAGQLYWAAIYTEAFDVTRALANHNLDLGMGLIGTNDGDDMTLGVTEPAETPTLSPSGIIGPFTDSVEVTITDPNEGTTVYYTDDDTPPGTGSLEYSSALTLTETTILRAIATGEEYSDSPEASGTYEIICATPTISPNGGNFIGSQEIALSTPREEDIIYYTLDESIPGTGSLEYSSPFTITESTIVLAYAVDDNCTDSAVASGDFYEQVATPEIEMVAPLEASGKYSFPASGQIEIIDDTEGSTIYYTTDGSTPDDGDTEYSDPFWITETTNVQAIATASGLIDSAVASQTFRKGSKRIRLFNHFNLWRQQREFLERKRYEFEKEEKIKR